MQLDNVTFISYLAGTILLTGFSLVACFLFHRRLIALSLTIAVFLSTAWCGLLAYDALDANLTIQQLLFWETLRSGSWIFGMLQQVKFTGEKNPRAKKIFGLFQLQLILVCAGVTLVIPHQLTNMAAAYQLLVWTGLVLAILSIIAAEQLFRNSPSSLNKIFSLGLIGVFLYDLYLFSYAQLFGQLDPELWQARGAINGILALFLSIALASASVGKTSLNQRNRVAISRPMAFYTTSITTAGFFLALMAAGGYYIKIYGGDWGRVLQVTLIFSALIAIAGIFLSQTLRANISVYINKHFFVHKYDYRTQWLNLIQQLTDPSGDGNPHQKAIKAMVSVIKCNGGILWMDNQLGSFIPVAFYNIDLPLTGMEEPSDSAFCATLRDQEWVFSPLSSNADELGKYNELLPSWSHKIENLSLIVPLLVDNQLVGFILLDKLPQNSSLTWEDLDLLKTVGREVASYISRNEAAELLAQSKQFDAYNKLSAFIMHDLKNLIAQQALVVENAAKHKENPAFIDDMIRTIDNSVQRMSNLLKKLQQTQPSTSRPLNLQNVVINAVKKCQDRIPPPSLRILSDSLKVVADEDNLEMIVTHVIKNAQEATPAEGYVDIELRQEGKHAVIEVEDNGCGMDSDFVKNRLFRPFDTTKSGKGMGIGVYQTREFIRSLGGEVTVTSELREGTTFTIYIPISVSLQNSVEGN